MRSCYLFCDGGFNNRFNVLLSGLVLAKKTKTHPIIIWEKTDGCGAEFHDIFDNNHEIYHNYDFKTFFDNHDTMNIVHDNLFLRDISFRNTFSFNSIDEVIAYVDSDNRDIFFYTNLRPVWVDQNFMFSEILPEIPFKKELMDISQKILDDNAGNQTFHGIHIRKTDFPSYNANMESNLYKIVSENKYEKFFICSDDEETEKNFKKNSNVFTYEKHNYTEKLVESLGWNDVVYDIYGRPFPFNMKRNKFNVIEAIVDMIILSKSNIIQTNMGSTFLQNAIMLNCYWKHIN